MGSHGWTPLPVALANYEPPPTCTCTCTWTQDVDHNLNHTHLPFTPAGIESFTTTSTATPYSIIRTRSCYHTRRPRSPIAAHTFTLHAKSPLLPGLPSSIPCHCGQSFLPPQASRCSLTTTLKSQSSTRPYLLPPSSYTATAWLQRRLLIRPRRALFSLSSWWLPLHEGIHLEAGFKLECWWWMSSSGESVPHNLAQEDARAGLVEYSGPSLNRRLRLVRMYQQHL